MNILVATVLVSLWGSSLARPQVPVATPTRIASSQLSNDDQLIITQKAKDEDNVDTISWTDKDGMVHSLTYQAYENGYSPGGDLVPAVPAAIQRAMEWNEAHPEEEDLYYQETPHSTTDDTGAGQ